ncbi:hypothetical protein BREU_2158 [Bifidobacterium reuteri DSM 23975]|uniref:Uncharacterized protein n=1 Tax=Bifidobacterium reuteri DSM 23975 TaxID=1437610 RepID=A0A087CF47_9BIFI|nr:hypothetical protein BREU_2158 [Bifidobacterium reuteri DSM 23975]
MTVISHCFSEVPITVQRSGTGGFVSICARAHRKNGLTILLLHRGHTLEHRINVKWLRPIILRWFSVSVRNPIDYHINIRHFACVNTARQPPSHPAPISLRPDAIPQFALIEPASVGFVEVPSLGAEAEFVAQNPEAQFCGFRYTGRTCDFSYASTKG